MKKMKWNEAKEFLKTNTALLEFGTEWCGTCQMMKPVMEELETKTEVQIIKVDAEESGLFRKEDSPIEVLRIPAYYLVKNDQYNFIGYKYKSVEELLENIEKYK